MASFLDTPLDCADDWEVCRLMMLVVLSDKECRPYVNVGFPMELILNKIQLIDVMQGNWDPCQRHSPPE